MTLLLMAAGNGSRYGKLKQFDELGPKGEFLMEFSLHDALNNGFNHIVAVTKKENVTFLQDYLSARLPENIQLDVVAQEVSDLPEGVTFSGERAKPWGTAHAVWTARNVVKGPFAIINADDYYGKEAFKSAADFMKSNTTDKTFGLVAYTLKNTLSEHGSVSRGVCTAENGKLTSINEHTKIEINDGTIIDTDANVEFTGEELVSMNFWVCHPSIFDFTTEYLKEFIADEKNIAKGEIYLPFAIKEMISRDMIDAAVIPSDSKWFGVTYANDKDMAVSELQKMTDTNGYPSPIWEAAQKV
ncbi:UTP-glucose-1-phosphate uridylyltransferase [Arenibacter nanhaiticus]|uniref:UTP-glucose-1-phosphate uridylyltransferase n=1 Tax=Arenibacter nanhaiticus TaxID=558155 RepID=A0A1M6IKS2_9FLAO|nr:sugar phosphate nucleotidyltransferase [Arenibacter nanhaiticus]SHJ35010.1 UTP-glucose-1-phosphate uridylyltransferase [Arenibacter nanhaiticus]